MKYFQMIRLQTITFLIISALLFCSKPVTKLQSGTDQEQSVRTDEKHAVIRKVPVPQIQPVPSTINVPLAIKTDVAEQMINQQLKDILYECDTLSLCNFKPVKIKVWKKDSIKISLNGDELQYKVPLRIWMQFSFTISALGLSHTEYQDVEASIALNFRSRIFVKNDWKIVTMTRSEGYEWLSDPVVKVHFLSIPVKPVADFLMALQQASFGELVDKAISSSLDIKKMIKPLWGRMQSPILLSASPDSLWLRLRPQGIYMTQLEGANQMIKGSIGIKSVAETFFGSQPEVLKNDALPEFVIPGKIDSTFVINLYNEITYESASQITRALLVGKSFSNDKYEAIINDINIYGLDGYAVISIDLSGYYKGKIYAIGRVQYDSSNQTITIEDLEFDLSTQNKLQKTADALFHKVILAKIKPFLKFPIKDRLLESQLLTQKMLANKEISKNVVVNGILDSLTIAGITCTDHGIRTTLLAKGVVTVQIRD
jgi:hypothetical protein